MRRALLGPFVVLAAGAFPACNAKPVGEMVLVVQTDLSLPKDVDTIRIEVTSQGIPKYKKDFDQLGTPKGEIKLPGTLSLLASDNPSDAVDIVVSARSGGKGGRVRMLREVVTTIPADRSVLMPLPVQFLCDGTSGSDDGAGNTVNKCAAGQTCLAGQCKDNKVDSSTLRSYEEKDALGDGSCFDPKHCYDNAKVADVDPATCTFDAGGPNVNVALQTEGDGLCSVTGCYVTLDARDPLGWNLTAEGKIQLPTAVCNEKKAAIVNVVYAPISDACKQKNTALPTCGPWSNAADNPIPMRTPVALAGGQAHPGSLTLGGGKILWTTAGAGGPAGGAVKSVDPAGGTPTLIASMTAARSVTTAKTSSGALTLWTTATSGMPMSGGVWVNDGVNTTQLQSGLLNPEGIAAVGQLLFWTDFTSGAIYVGKTSPSMKSIAATGNYPFRIVADSRYAYWTNEGTAAKMDGSIGRFDTQTGIVDTLAMNQATPRATALEVGSNGSATAIYFATFIKNGGIYRVDLTGAAPGAPTPIATGLAYPNGIAVDDANVYFTARDDGKILSLGRKAMKGTAPTVLADGQASPAAIAVDGAAVYWVNEGSSLAANGAIIKLDKAPAP